MVETMQGFTAWDSIAARSMGQLGALRSYVDDQFCVPSPAGAFDGEVEGGAMSDFVLDQGQAPAGMGGPVPMIGYTDWDPIAKGLRGGRFAGVDLRHGRGLGEYVEEDFCLPMSYEDPPAGLAGLGGCSCGGACDDCGGGLGSLTNPQSLLDWAMLAGLVGGGAFLAMKFLRPKKSKALRQARLAADARRAKILADYA